MKHRLAILAILVVTGCAQVQPVALPAVELAGQWRAAGSAAPSNEAWWKAFGDATLDALERQALAANLDLQQAQSRLEQARSAAGLAQATLAPAAQLDASAGRVQQSLNAGLGTLSNYVPNFARMADPGQLALSASWDLDFAGGLRSQREAAGASLAAKAAELQALRLGLSAEVADAYFTALAAGFQRAALLRQLDLLRDQLRIMETRVRLGAAAPIELDRLQAAIEEATTPLASLSASMAVQRSRLALLLGQDPTRWDAVIDRADQMPVAPDPAAGVPADVVRRRPDVLAAEQRVASAGASLAASMAEYYPRISLLAALGQDAGNVANLDSSRSTFAQAFLGLRWRLFDFGRIDAEVQLAKGRQRESLLSYRAAVLRAASEVESSFAQLAAARERLGHSEEQAARVRQISRTFHSAFKAGALSADDVLGADRNVARTEFELTVARLDVARAVAQAARALGGPLENNRSTDQRD